MILYICQDGLAPSGVATYGYHLLRARPQARMLLLNADGLPPAVPLELASRITTLLEAESHDPSMVANVIDTIAKETDCALTILPNTGDTPWTATAQWLQRADGPTRAKVRVLGIVHSDVETQYALADRYHKLVPLWLGVSRRCAAELVRRVGVNGVSVYELPYPIEVPEAAVKTDQGPLRLAYVGRLEEQQKRVFRLVELFKALVAIGVDFTATVVGDGPEAPAFAEAVQAAGKTVHSRVRITGTLNRMDIDEVWRTHDVALLVSVFEGLPFAMLEAMAAGVCPVAMVIGSGLCELIDDGVEGRIIPQGDVSAMATILAELAGDRKTLRRMSTAARLRVLNQFAPERHFARLGEILNELWRLPAPDAARLTPDPTAAAIEQMVNAAAGHGRPVAVYGAGMVGRKVVDSCIAQKLEVGGWFDSDLAKAGMAYRGLVCQPPAMMVDTSDAVFVAASLQLSSEIAAKIASVFAGTGVAAPVIIVHET